MRCRTLKFNPIVNSWNDTRPFLGFDNPFAEIIMHTDRIFSVEDILNIQDNEMTHLFTVDAVAR